MSQEIVRAPSTVPVRKCPNASFKGTALIADAASSMGAVYSDRLAHRGYDLILVGRDRERLSALARRLAVATGRAVVVLAADLNEKADLAHVEQVLRSDPSITMLVNNIWTAPSRESVSAEVEGLEHMSQPTVLAPPRLSLAAIRGFVQRGSGTLIDSNATLTLAQEPWSASYTGGHAHLELSSRLQREFAPEGVRVQLVLVGASRMACEDRAEGDAAGVPPGVLIDVEAVVDASLVGLDQGESVTTPSLPTLADWG